MAKKCMSCGGAMKKMQKGGTNVKMGIYGIPQENIGTSSQYQPTAKKGGAVKKMAKGGPVKKMLKGGPSGEALRLRGMDMKFNGIDLKDAGTYQKELGREMKIAGKGLKAKGMVKKAEGQTLKAAGKILSKKQTGGATKFGMLSVKAGVDKNPRATAADRIAGAKKSVKKK